MPPAPRFARAPYVSMFLRDLDDRRAAPVEPREPTLDDRVGRGDDVPPGARFALAGARVRS